jgi:hypothetical protein
MRQRLTRTLLTVTAAGVTITTLGLAAGAAAAAGHHGARAFTPSAPQTATDANCSSTTVTGTYSGTDCGKAGYVASGRDFRYAQALIMVPDHTGITSTDPGIDADPALYVALDASAASNDFARAGVRPCSGGSNCGSSGWQAFVDIEEPGSPAISDSVALSPQVEGDGVFVSVYFNAMGDSVHAEVIPPSGTPINDTYHVNGPVYTDAQAFADWTTDTAKPQPVPPSGDKVRDTQFLQGRFTTLSGAQGTFVGPWSLTAVDATSNGALPPQGTLIGQPGYLWTDNSSLSGMFGDAFGIWRYPF